MSIFAKSRASSDAPAISVVTNFKSGCRSKTPEKIK